MYRLLRVAAMAIVITAVLGSTAYAFSADPYEPDGSRATAKPVPVGDTIKDMRIQDRTIYPAGDRDWASFVASGGVTYYFAAMSNPIHMRVNGNVYDANGVLLRGMRNLEFIYPRTTWTAPSDGTYYIRFDSPTAPTPSGTTYPYVGAYAIRIGAAPPSARMLDAAEPDNTTATAKPMPRYRSSIPYFVMNSLARGTWHTTSNPGSHVDTDTFSIDLSAADASPLNGVEISLASDQVTRRFLNLDVIGPNGSVVSSSGPVYVGTGPLGNAVWAFLPNGGAGRYYIRIFGMSQPYYYRPYYYVSQEFGL